MTETVEPQRQLTDEELAAPLGGEFPNRPHHVLDQLRERCPVAKVTSPAGRKMWLVTSASHVRAGLQDSRFSSQAMGALASDKPFRALEASLLSYDSPDHPRIRRLANAAFTMRRMRTHRPTVEAAARDLFDALPQSPTPDLMAGFAGPFTFRVMCDLYGLPEAIRPRFRHLIDVVSVRKDHSLDELNDTIDELGGIFASEVRKRIEAPADDLWSDIVRVWKSVDDVTEKELISLSASIMLAGVDSVAQTLGICFAFLLTHGGLIPRLHADPALVAPVVEEILRMDSPTLFTTRRKALEDVTFGDTLIPAGSEVLFSVTAANRDPDRYRSPDRLVLNRPAAEGHIAFGLGPHRCIGAALARIELAVAVAELTRRWPAIALAMPAADLRWENHFAHRRLVELPVVLG